MAELSGPDSAGDGRRESWRRRGVVAGMAALAAALVGKVTDREPDVAYAADFSCDNLSVNGNVTFTNPGTNQFRDIHTTGNASGLRFYNADALTITPDGAAIQFWGNGTGLPGQAFIDSGANDSATINLRTAGTGQTVSTKLSIDARGNVTINGSLSVTGIKAFVMDHPLDPANSYLYHNAVEAPEQLNVYSGNVVTNSGGEATVSLPSYFQALNRDIRYQLTVVGQFAQAIVASKVHNGQFQIKTDKPNVEVSWQVSGVRNDAVARLHPFHAEQPKAEADRGHYLTPEAFGRPATDGISWQRSPEKILNIGQ